MTCDQIRALLNIVEGGGAQLWQYAVSHQELVIVIGKKGSATNVVLVCGGCGRVAGPTSWKPARIDVIERPNSNKEAQLVVSDVAAGLEVHCSSVAAVRKDGFVPLDWIRIRNSGE
jgi:hypothetical protein